MLLLVVRSGVQKLLFYACSLSASALIYGCTICSCQKVPCPGFHDTEFINWFPYESASTLVFTNGQVQDTLSLPGYEKSGDYEATKGCLNGSTGCSSYATLTADERTNNGMLKFRVEVNELTKFGSSSSSRMIYLTWHDFNLSYASLGPEGLLPDTAQHMTTRFYPSLSLGGNTFTSVQEIHRDTLSSKTSGIYKIYISKFKGLIGYEEYPSLTTFTLQ